MTHRIHSVLMSMASSIALGLALAPWAHSVQAQAHSSEATPPVSAATKGKPVKKKPSRKATRRSDAESPGAVAAGAAGSTSLAMASAPLPALSEAQLEVAKTVQTGDIACSDQLRVKVLPLPHAPGYFHVQLGVKDRFEMAPVPTSTGAVRLEDPARGGVWIQLPAKSMLMNTKLGQRMADACRTEAQQAIETAAQDNPPPDLLDPKTEVVQR